VTTDVNVSKDKYLIKLKLPDGQDIDVDCQTVSNMFITADELGMDINLYICFVFSCMFAPRAKLIQGDYTLDTLHLKLVEILLVSIMYF